ncbi:subclass B1 metallo-beta-lactamase [Maribacter sp. 2210JD10-5]|uniref:subclass B1 metallo-beta-lactamase n=1 Tax=Maribacter sp. 2210JD10-5 TaxID=3386272 RepID=UPI0039BD2CFD
MSVKAQLTYDSKTLQIKQISKNSFIHISYLKTDDFGKVAANGLVYFNKNEAIVFDTTNDEESSKELIHWIKKTKSAKIKAVVINHFHVDALGGIQAFHEENIPSIAHEKTITLIKNDTLLPQIGFTDIMAVPVGDAIITNRFFGEAHTSDNIISHIPKEKLIYGGCMVKTIGAGNGNLEDANLGEWSNTIKAIKTAYPDTKIVIPGHGKHGGMDLLDYTENLFLPKNED